MYRPNHFKMPDEEIASFIQTYPLAILITDYEESQIINFAPMILSRDKRCLEGHLANMNPHLQAMAENPTISLVFQGVSAYISPNWYQDKTQVPTWNFEAVIVKGSVSLVTSNAKKRSLLERASKFHEDTINSDWTLSKMPENKLNAMIDAITGFLVEIESWQGKSKLSQNKSVAERENLLRGLSALDTPESVLMSDKMSNT